MDKRRMLELGKPLTLLVAALLTFASLWVLGLLNSRASSDVPLPEPIRTVLIRGPRADRAQAKQSETDPEPELPEPEFMEVQLDAPPPEKVIPEPLELDLSLPSPRPVPVEVAVEQPAPESRPSPPRQSTSSSRAESSARKASAVDQAPRESGQNPAPTYPAGKLRQGVEGTVKLRLLIDKSGKIEEVEVLRGDEEFRRAVMSVVWDWRFTPARHRGRPVKVWGVKEVQFKLRQRDSS